MNNKTHNRDVPFEKLLLAVRRALLILLDAVEDELEYEPRNVVTRK